MEVQTESLAARIAVGDANVQDAEVVAVVESAHSNVVQNDKLVRIFTKIRDARKKLSAEFDLADNALKLQLDAVATELKRRCLETGQTGFKTDFGTVYITETLNVGCSDWTMFGDWLKDKDPLAFLESRIKKTAIKEYMEAHKGELPPGVTTFRETEARVRAPAKSGKAEPEEV